MMMLEIAVVVKGVSLSMSEQLLAKGHLVFFDSPAVPSRPLHLVANPSNCAQQPQQQQWDRARIVNRENAVMAANVNITQLFRWVAAFMPNFTVAQVRWSSLHNHVSSREGRAGGK